jgi:hypothetical protein
MSRTQPGSRPAPAVWSAAPVADSFLSAPGAPGGSEGQAGWCDCAGGESDHPRARRRPGLADIHPRTQRSGQAIMALGDELAADRTPSVLPRSASPSRASRATCTRSFATTATRLRLKRFAMRSATRTPRRSRSRSAAMTTNIACASVTMGEGSVQRCSKDTESRGTSDCAECPNAALIGGKGQCGAAPSRVYVTSPTRPWWSPVCLGDTA